MAGKKINAFNELCKDTMIANMADTLKAYGGFPELEKTGLRLKSVYRYGSRQRGTYCTKCRYICRS